MHLPPEKKHIRRVLKSVLIVLAIFLAVFYTLSISLHKKYRSLESVVIKDRNGEIIAIRPNLKDNFAIYTDSLPDRLKTLLIQKEDKYFYVHFGINPISIVRAIVQYIRTDDFGASSTITQQLVKNLLGNEQKRTVPNKLEEMIYTISLELSTSKEKILLMYGNTVYMGNQIQGLAESSRGYFGKNLDDLTDTEVLSLIATISNPSNQNPWKNTNISALHVIAKRLNVSTDTNTLNVIKTYRAIQSADFELESLLTCMKSCETTIDKNLTDNLRNILARNISETSSYGGRNGAIVVIKLPENELLAIVGTPDTRGTLDGGAINMAVKPRPIGSTIKPFIYLKGFEKGLRPYSTVDDREYKFSIANGFPLYPKNYDGAYRGTVTLRQALSNSLNVPTVKVLQYVTLNDFYDFLEKTLQFISIQPIDTYQYGIALGGLEMDPLTLSHFMTIFANKGVLTPMKLYKGNSDLPAITPPMEKYSSEVKVADEKYVQLVNKITNDRLAGVEQFGLAGNLNLPQDNYTVKTGTSRDFHDTWTIGFTPDFLVTVWLGNVENEPMRQITSASGAGKIWHDAMELLLNSDYNKKTPLDFSLITPYTINNSVEYGLPRDDIKKVQDILSEKTLITNPHDGDTFEYTPNMQIKLQSSSSSKWYANGRYVGEGTNVPFNPQSTGTYKIKASIHDKTEQITIRIVEK